MHDGQAVTVKAGVQNHRHTGQFVKLFDHPVIGLIVRTHAVHTGRVVHMNGSGDLVFFTGDDIERHGHKGRRTKILKVERAVFFQTTGGKGHEPLPVLHLVVDDVARLRRTRIRQHAAPAQGARAPFFPALKPADHLALGQRVGHILGHAFAQILPDHLIADLEFSEYLFIAERISQVCVLQLEAGPAAVFLMIEFQRRAHRRTAVAGMGMDENPVDVGQFSDELVDLDVQKRAAGQRHIAKGEALVQRFNKTEDAFLQQPLRRSGHMLLAVGFDQLHDAPAGVRLHQHRIARHHDIVHPVGIALPAAIGVFEHHVFDQGITDIGIAVGGQSHGLALPIHIAQSQTNSKGGVPQRGCVKGDFLHQRHLAVAAQIDLAGDVFAVRIGTKAVHADGQRFVKAAAAISAGGVGAMVIQKNHLFIRHAQGTEPVAKHGRLVHFEHVGR
ncbi:MAG: hypothetical protein BWY83_00605 [bacterium ADurb.Bin478]|nr:MAG: hypothetical protein BWY83_00605 [bacterium ADurb.Bin478]